MPSFKTDTATLVYNFKADSTHSYFVGGAAVLVHNADYTQWGWTGTKAWKNLVKKVRYGGTIEELEGKVATETEAKMLLKEAGAKFIRTEEGHAFPNPHTYKHINYETQFGKGTIKIGD